MILLDGWTVDGLFNHVESFASWTAQSQVDQVDQREYARGMEIVNSYEAKAKLSQLIRRALAGERIVIARAGKPLIELTPFRPSAPRRGGQWKGRVHMTDDFDEPLEDFEAALYDAPDSA